MRIRIDYVTTYAYAAPARSMVQLLRLQPREHGGQRVARWRVEVDADGRLRRGEDGFGNILHTFTLGRPTQSLRVRVSGEVNTSDTAGLLSNTAERFPPGVYLRPTPLTELDRDLCAFADEVLVQAGPEPLDRLHALMAAIRARVRFQSGQTSANTTAGEAFRLGEGVCQDLTHVFIACARRAGLPARYVSGHLVREDREDQEAGHAWAEAHVPDLGWVGFDAANGVSPTERHLRVAAGPDYLSAAPVRGARSGGGEERMEVSLTVADAAKSPLRAAVQGQAQALS